MYKIIEEMELRIFLLAFLTCLLPLPTKAQEISSDSTTDTEVTLPDGQNFDINGGDRLGGNLFHSFGNFSVTGGSSANYNNASDPENLFCHLFHEIN